MHSVDCTYIAVYVGHLLICVLWLSIAIMLGMPSWLVEIADSHWDLSCLTLVVMPIRIKLKEGVVQVWVLFSLSCMIIVGRFTGWFMNFPTLANWVSTFHSSTGGSCTMSFTLQDLLFPVAWRSYLSYSIQTILYPALHFRSHFPGCLCLKYTLSLIWMFGAGWSVVFCTFLILFSCGVFLAMAKATWCISRLGHPEFGSPRKHCIVSSGWCSGTFGSLPKTRKRVFLL